MMSNECVEPSSHANGKRLLDIRNLSVDYYAASGTVHALDNVSITLERGQILGLAGESGSGKSTLAYAITRLLHPPAAITGGEILYYPRLGQRGPQRAHKRVFSLLRRSPKAVPMAGDANPRERLNFSVIFITHDLSLLLEIADKIAIMYAGRVVETTTNLELLRQPRHPYSYGLLNSFPTLHGPSHRMTGIPGFPPDLRAAPPGSPFHPRCPMAFGACSARIPVLRPSAPETPGQFVACHLYDPVLNTGRIPTNDEFAAEYEAHYEIVQGMERRR